ncbi:hypothetical protein [Helicobacter sp. 23-1045]
MLKSQNLARKSQNLNNYFVDCHDSTLAESRNDGDFSLRSK